jgi:ferric-dicitrate binding protein FerR (iron transport regulator)
VNDDKNDIVKELIPRYLTGEASSEEERKLLTWIAETPENEREYLGCKKIFESSETYYSKKATEELDVDIDKEWNHFLGNIAEKDARIRTLEPKTPSYGIWYKIAATVLLIAVSVYLINNFISQAEDKVYQTAEHPLSVELPDGSTVILNRQSQLSVTTSFNRDHRTVNLTGEAFFDVTHNATKPFVINVNNAQVEVVGTSFNIRAYNMNNEVEVIVKTGLVKLSVPELKTEIKLSAGQRGIYATEKKKLDSSVNTDINFLAWNTREIIFEETDLRTVIETLNKTYGVTIVIAADVPASCVVTVTFDHQTLEAVLHVLETTLNLTYTINGNQITITSAGC